MVDSFFKHWNQSRQKTKYFTMAEKNVQTILFLCLFIALSISCSTTAFPSRKAKQCGRYQPARAQRESKIVGGMRADAGEFPWMVSFKSKHGHFCGGAVIHDRFILSAAHCFYRNEFHLEYSKDGSLKLSSLNLTVGEYSIKNPSESSEVTLSLKGIHLHPKYDPVKKQNDIALVEISKRIAVVAPSVMPVCLPPADESLWEKGSVATVAGWGKRDHSQDYYDWMAEVNLLQKVDVTIWGKDECIEKYKGFPKFPTASFICAGEHGRESCAGDSGGPLLRLSGNNKWVVIGVVANGNKCGALGRPGIYTLVSDFTAWIQSYAK